jgi:AraC family transcriptional regulator
MSAEVEVRSTSPALDTPTNGVSDFDTSSEASRARYSEAEVERAGLLIRRAMSFVDSDREAAWRCLKDASALLGSAAQHPSETATSENLVFRQGGLARWQTKRTLAYIEANLGSKMVIHELAGLVAFSKSHFSRAFKRSLGLSPMEYVVTRRVERAKVLMASTPERLTEIALACGFADQSHLNRSFRRIVGVSPGVWRRTHAEAASSIRRRRDSAGAEPMRSAAESGDGRFG